MGVSEAVRQLRMAPPVLPLGVAFLQIDLMNAFNSIDRQGMLDQVAARMPTLLPWALGFYCGIRLVLSAGGHPESARGSAGGPPMSAVLRPCLAPHGGGHPASVPQHVDQLLLR